MAVEVRLHFEDESEVAPPWCQDTRTAKLYYETARNLYFLSSSHQWWGLRCPRSCLIEDILSILISSFFSITFFFEENRRRLLLSNSQNVTTHNYYLFKRSLNALIQFRIWLRWLCIKREQLGESATNALADMHQQFCNHFKEQYK